MNELETMPTVEMNAFLRWVAEATERYLEIPENKRRFEEWKREKAKRKEVQMQNAEGGMQN